MRRLLLVALVLGTVLFGGSALVLAQTASDPLDSALGYLPRDAVAVVAVSTDLEGDQLRQLDGRLRALGAVGPQGLTGELRSAAREGGLDFDRTVRPLLGNELVVGVTSAEDDGDVVAALEVRQTGLLQAALDRPRTLRPARPLRGARVYRMRGGGLVALNGDELVFADSAATLDRALRQRTQADRLTRAGFEGRLGTGVVPAFARGYARVEPRQVAEALEIRRDRLAQVPWLAALRSVGFSASASPDGLSAAAAFNTPAGVRPADLPLAAGSQPPLAVARRGRLVTADRNPAQQGRFLLDLVQATDPRGAFERRRRQVERRRKVDLRRDIIGQFSGNSVLTLGPRGTFAVRSEVRDPSALARTLRRLRPALPGLLRAGTGERVRVAPIRGRRDLYRASMGSEHVVFGLAGDQFVAGSDERRARGLAAEPLVPVTGARGASLVSVHLGRFLRELDPRVAEHLGELTVTAEASPTQVRSELRVGVHDGGPRASARNRRRAQVARHTDRRDDLRDGLERMLAPLG